MAKLSLMCNLSRLVIGASQTSTDTFLHQDVNRLLRVCELGDEAGLQLLLDSGYKVGLLQHSRSLLEANGRND